MRKIYLLLILFGFLFLTAAKSDKAAYRLFDSKGKEVDYEDLLKAAKKADVIFFGELHDNPICHWLELELTKDLFAEKKDNLILGAEMFERDNQLLLNEYLSKMIRKKDFEAEAKLWKNYGTDYAPIVDFAAKNNIPFIATSVPRRYAALVNRLGFEGLDSINALQRGMIAPLPIKYDPELDCYKKMKEMMGDAGNAHGSDNIMKAQALKDATMAHFLLKNGKEGMSFLHFNGAYHSDRHQGIVWYLNEYNKRTAFTLTVLTISTVEQESTKDLDEKSIGLADFIICIPESMTKTQVSASSSAPSMKPAVPVMKKDSTNTSVPK